MASQRRMAPAAPISMSAAGVRNGGSRPWNANSTISARTPSAHSAAMVEPSRPAWVQAKVEKP